MKKLFVLVLLALPTVVGGGAAFPAGETDEAADETAEEFAPGTVLEPSRYLLVGESGVANADIQATLDIPDAWTNDPTTGVRLRWGGAATNGMVADVVFIGKGPFNSAGLETTGWLSTTSVWNYAGRVQKRWFPGLDTDRDNDWHWVSVRAGHNWASGVVDSDQDGLTDAQEWNGTLSQTGASTNQKG